MIIKLFKQSYYMHKWLYYNNSDIFLFIPQTFARRKESCYLSSIKHDKQKLFYSKTYHSLSDKWEGIFKGTQIILKGRFKMPLHLLLPFALYCKIEKLTRIIGYLIWKYVEYTKVLDIFYSSSLFVPLKYSNFSFLEYSICLCMTIS